MIRPAPSPCTIDQALATLSNASSLSDNQRTQLTGLYHRHRNHHNARSVIDALNVLEVYPKQLTRDERTTLANVAAKLFSPKTQVFEGMNLHNPTKDMRGK